MQFTDIFIRRPVLALVISLLIIIAGLQAVRSLNVRQYPRSDNASVTVNTIYVGASADLVRGFITTPLERAIAAARLSAAEQRRMVATSQRILLLIMEERLVEAGDVLFVAVNIIRRFGVDAEQALNQFIEARTAP